MHKMHKFIFMILYTPLLIPFVFLGKETRRCIDVDASRYLDANSNKLLHSIVKLLCAFRYFSFRAIFLHRIKYENFICKLFFHIYSSLYSLPAGLIIYTRNIGEGLFIEHGVATIISAEKIGINCSINQQVTIGWSKNGNPELGDNVSVCAGAKILGMIKVGNNVVVGANAVVVKNVPNNCVVVGVPARIIRRNGVRVDESL